MSKSKHTNGRGALFAREPVARQDMLPAQEDQPEQQPAPPNPWHPRAVFLVKKQAYRRFIAAGGVPTP